MTASERRRSSDGGAPEFDRHARGVTTISEAARRDFAATVRGLVTHRADAAGHLGRCLAHDPDCAAALLLKGFALRLLGRRDLVPNVLRCLESARASFALRGASARELALAEALEAWAGGRVPAAAERLEAELRREPTDLLLLKLAHAIRFMAGDLRGLLRGVQAVRPAHPEGTAGLAYVLGCEAFALEENRRYAEAERLGREAVDRAPDDVWGLHAVAHVLLETDRPAEGLAWLLPHDAMLGEVNNLAGHVYWHRALFHLARDETEAARDLLVQRVGIYPPRDYRDVSNASTLALQLAARGVDVGAAWEVPLLAARERLGDHGLAFADVHYLLCLAWAGEPGEAEAFVASMERVAARPGEDHDREVLRTVGLPLAHVTLAALRGEVETARDDLKALGETTQRIGGSHAQRRVLDWILEAGRVRRSEAS